jgi:hypothetical protein
VSVTGLFVVFFLEALASCAGIRDGGGGAWLLVFWASATCSAAAFQFGIAPHRTTSASAWPGIGWLCLMVGAGIALSVGGLAAWTAGFQSSDSLVFVGLTAMVIGMAWSLGDVLLAILELFGGDVEVRSAP